MTGLRGMGERNAEVPEARGIATRIGIDPDEPVIEVDDNRGGGVILTAHFPRRRVFEL